MELARGVRDFGPEEMQLRNDVLRSIRRQFRLHGFEPLETPLIERMETLNAKMEGADSTDVAKEIFRVEDQGGRDLGLRYDLTVPLARYVAMHKELKMPFRRYEIGKVYRDGPVKLGRYREFIQCDADIVGSKSMIADAEALHLASAVFRELGIDATIKVSNRCVLDALCTKLGIAEPQQVIISIDKLEKIGRSGVSKELSEKGITDEQQEKLFGLLLVEGTTNGKLKLLEDELGPDAVAPLRELFTYLQVTVEFSPSLARGLAYYTGTVFEAFANDSSIKSSLMGGGRYDNLVSAMGGDSVPAVGVSFGIEPICEVLKEQRGSEMDSDTQLFVIPIGNTKVKCIALLQELREQGIACAMDLMDRSPSKNIEYAGKLRIPHALIVGEKELLAGTLTLKDLKTGDEQKIKESELGTLKLILEA